MKCGIEVETNDKFIKIKNISTDHRVIVYIKPLAPKRKWIEVSNLRVDQSLIFDLEYDDVELERISYQFELKK
jgi:hypothetical protein